MTESDITITRRTEGLAEVVTVAGEVDIYTAPALREVLYPAVSDGPGTVVVDMTGVDFLDSTGLGAMVGAHKRARDKGGTVVIAGAQDWITKQFKVTGLAKVFALHPAVDEALEALAGLAITTEAEVTP